MSIDPKLLLSNFPVIVGTLGLLIVGKTMLVVIMGKLFGISIISAIRVGLLLAPGGEFAFVAFGEAVNQVCYQNVFFSFPIRYISSNVLENVMVFLRHIYVSTVLPGYNVSSVIFVALSCRGNLNGYHPLASCWWPVNCISI